MPVIILAGLCWILFFYRLAERDLWSSHEGRAAQNAATVLRLKEWGVPKLFDEHRELQKPPLYYWLVALAAQIRGAGVDAWAVRLPAALTAVAVVLGLYFFLCARGRPLAGWLAATVLATALHFTWLGRVGRIDMPLTFVVGLALVCFFCSRRAARDWTGRFVWVVLQLLGYVAMAAAVMLKGPIGAVLPLAVLSVHALVERDCPLGRWLPSTILRSSLWWGVPLVLALTVPYYSWINDRTEGQFFQVFFWHHNVERGLGGAEDLTVHPWWYYGPRWLVDFLPWSPLVLAAGWYLLRRNWREDAEARYGLVWFGTMFLVMSAASFKRADYLLPAYPGAALLLGCVAEGWYRRAVHPRRLAAALAVILAGCVAGWWLIVERVFPQHEPQREMRTFAREVRRHVPAPDFVHFFRAESHALAFHLGYPLDTFLEWENLDVYAGLPGTYYIVMPPDCAEEWPQHLKSGRLVEVVRNTDLCGGRHEKPLVLMRTVPSSRSTE